MRPIDDTIVLQAIDHLRDVYMLKDTEYYERIHQNNPIANALRHIEKKVKSAPIAYSVPHAHWIRITEKDYNDNAKYECSNCHAGDEHAVSKIIPYCWKCGFLMDEPEEINLIGEI